MFLSRSIRGDGTSDFYFPPEVPALANFTVQKVVTDILEQEKKVHHIGITHTTNKRFWEFNSDFRTRLQVTRPQAVEMECATLFTASYSHRLPLGALLLISDLPLTPRGAKTKDSSEAVFVNFMPEHIRIGVQIIRALQQVERLRAYRKHVHYEGGMRLSPFALLRHRASFCLFTASVYAGTPH